eukprot:GHVS01008788.1.p2 GENE.GHVS01008788.1~~GHVS01008788.1.p2  ORF type:complete len:175 (-),score=38.17 GHVS01008788.1:141-665(-)
MSFQCLRVCLTATFCFLVLLCKYTTAPQPPLPDTSMPSASHKGGGHQSDFSSLLSTAAASLSPNIILDPSSLDCRHSSPPCRPVDSKTQGGDVLGSMDDESTARQAAEGLAGGLRRRGQGVEGGAADVRRRRTMLSAEQFVRKESQNESAAANGCEYCVLAGCPVYCWSCELCQ